MLPDNQLLYPDAAQRVMALMKSTFGAEGQIFNAYFLGLPDDVVIPQDAFPCVIVDKVVGTYNVGATGTDDITEDVYIHIMVDVKTGFGRPDTDNFVKRQLQTLVEGRDPSTGALLPNTVMYAVRKNLTLNSGTAVDLPTINNEVHISYDSPKRPEMPETRECVITMTVTERQVIGVRS
jgi:hypothetical protein